MALELDFEVRWLLGRDGEREALDPNVLALLRGVRKGGHLNFAARETGVSYRHAWGLLREWEKRLGQPLIAARQGRGAHLTAFGEALLAIAADTDAALASRLEEVALDSAARLAEAADTRRQVITVVSSHSERVRALRERLTAQHRVALDFVGSEIALHRYRRGEADIVGFHLPMGELGRSVAAHLIGLLDAERDRIFLLEQRTLGLVSRATAPVASLAVLAAGKHRFINRQTGSGTRLILDGLLGEQGIAPGDIRGYADEEYTHTAIAALVASDGADAGLASAAAAKQMDLHFVPVVEERFYVALARHSDSQLLLNLQQFCAEQVLPDRAHMKADELVPSVAVLKRVHRAGFWKEQRR